MVILGELCPFLKEKQMTYIYKHLSYLQKETERWREEKMFISNMLWVEKNMEGGVMTITVFDRHIRLQKEHPAWGWGHMVLPSAGIALDQVTTLTQGHDCLRFVPFVSLV